MVKLRERLCREAAAMTNGTFGTALPVIRTTAALLGAALLLGISGCTSDGSKPAEVGSVEATTDAAGQELQVPASAPEQTIQRDPSIPVASATPLRVRTVPAAPQPTPTEPVGEPVRPTGEPTGVAGRCLTVNNEPALIPPPQQAEDAIVLAFATGNVESLEELRRVGAGSLGDEQYQWMLTDAIRANCTRHVELALRYGAQPWRLSDGQNVDPISAALIFGTQATVRTVLAAAMPALTPEALTTRLFVAGCQVPDANVMIALDFGAKRTQVVGDSTETLDGIRAEC